ncbi:MAG: PAS domain S-box protein, partial [Acidimicrobiales bacterium]
ASREAVSVPDLQHDDRFPRFAARAVDQGLAAVFAFPLKAGDHQFGALDLYQTTTGTLSEEAMVAAQTLADVAAAYLLNAQARVDLEESLEQVRQSARHDDLSVEALRVSEARKKGILDAVPDGVITIDEHGLVVEFNPAAERTFGYSQQEALGRELAELIIPEAERDAHRNGIRHYRATGEGPLIGRRVEMQPIRADGSSFPAEVTIMAVATAGTPLFTGFVRDLTEVYAADVEREALEHRLHQTGRLESLGQLAGGVAHDFNNLLTVILNYAAFIAEAAPAESPMKAHAEEILASAERAAALTKQLLMYARREPLRRTAVDLNAVVAQVRDLLVRTIGEHVRVEVRAGADLPPIHADKGQVEQVLMNLSVNSRDAMPNGGVLTIETALMELRAGEAKPHPTLVPGLYVRLSVSDEGAGMSAEVVARAFDPFFSTKRSGEGTGLGLATVYGIVVDTGGAVDVQSEEGVGTTVVAYLPTSSEAPAPSLEAVDVVLGAGETVLVVEDQRAVREVTVAMLGRNGYRVRDAADAAEALLLSADIDFDLLLTDVVMPETSGPELVKALRDRDGTCQVLFMSGYSGDAFGSERVLDGAEALIHKPFKESELLQAVHDALHRSGTSRRSPR